MLAFFWYKILYFPAQTKKLHFDDSRENTIYNSALQKICGSVLFWQASCMFLKAQPNYSFLLTKSAAL